LSISEDRSVVSLYTAFGNGFGNVVEDGELVNFLVADKVKAELFQVCSSIKLNNCAVFADREAALLGWVFVFSLAEWSNADGHLDVIAIIHTFFIGSKDIVTQCRAHSSV